MFKKLRNAWKLMSTKEKVLLGIEVVCDLGCDFLTMMLINKVVPEGTKRWKRACIGVAGFGLGMCAGEAASNSIHDLADMVWKDKKEEEDDDA